MRLYIEFHYSMETMHCSMWQAVYTDITEISALTLELQESEMLHKGLHAYYPHSHYRHVVEGYIGSQEPVGRTNELLKGLHRAFACKASHAKFDQNKWYAPQPQETEPDKQEDEPSTISSMPGTDAGEPPYVASAHH